MCNMSVKQERKKGKQIKEEYQKYWIAGKKEVRNDVYIIQPNNNNNNNNNKLNLQLTDPKGATPINQTSATDWKMAARRDNVISITLRKV